MSIIVGKITHFWNKTLGKIFLRKEVLIPLTIHDFSEVTGLFLFAENRSESFMMKCMNECKKVKL